METLAKNGLTLTHLLNKNTNKKCFQGPFGPLYKIYKNLLFTKKAILKKSALISTLMSQSELID